MAAICVTNLQVKSIWTGLGVGMFDHHHNNKLFISVFHALFQSNLMAVLVGQCFKKSERM